MDLDRGRKAAGGKIEVMVKIREPFVDKDVEIVNEKWLVLDSHLRSLQIVSILQTAVTFVGENLLETISPGSE